MSEQNAERSYQVALVQGASFKIGNVAWRHGQIRTYAEGSADLEYYRNNSRFAVRPSPLRPEAKEARERSRAEARARRAEREPVAPAPKPESQIKDSSHLQAFPERVLALARQSVDAAEKRDALDRMARELGALGPEGQTPDKAKNKGEVVAWIQRRQAEVLAGVREAELRRDAPPAPEPVAPAVEEEEPLEDDLDEEGADPGIEAFLPGDPDALAEALAAYGLKG